MTRENLEAYVSGLDDLDPASLATAAEQARKSSKFFPSIAELREIEIKTRPVPLLTASHRTWRDPAMEEIDREREDPRVKGIIAGLREKLRMKETP